MYFLFEWTVKFAAFEHKLPGFRDHWRLAEMRGGVEQSDAIEVRCVSR